MNSTDMSGYIQVTPQKTSVHRMVLRSACKQCCSAGSDLELRKRTFKAKGKGQSQSPSVHLHHHHHHHHSEIIDNKKVNKTNGRQKEIKKLVIDNQSKLDEDLKESKLHDDLKESKLHSTVTYQKLHKKETIIVHKSNERNTYSDYSSGFEESDSDEKLKTEYTYARSESYRSTVTPDHFYDSPNMSRTRLRSRATCYNVKPVNGSSSDSEEASIDVNSTFNESRGDYEAVNHQRRSNIFPLRQFNSNSHINNSEDYANYTNSILNKRSGYRSINNSFKKYQAEYSDDEDEPQFQKPWKTQHTQSVDVLLANFASKICSLAIVEWTFSWLHWLLWRVIYCTICNGLLLDTWILSRCSSFGKKKLALILVLLALLPLLWKYGLFSTRAISVLTSPLAVITSVLSNLFSLVTSLLSFLWFGNATEKVNEVPVKSSEGSWFSWIALSTLFNGNKNENLFHSSNYNQDDVRTSEKELREAVLSSMDTQHIKSIVQEMLSEELLKITDVLNKKQDNMQSKQAWELSIQEQKLNDLTLRINAFLNHTRHLTDEYIDVKSQLKINEEGTIEAISKVEESNHTVEERLNLINSKIVELEKWVSMLKNCCSNHSDYLAAIETKLATLFLEIMNGSQKSSSSPFGAFSDWLHSSFVSEDNLASRMSVIIDNKSSDLSASLERRAEIAAKAAAAAIVSESEKALRSEMDQKTTEKSTGFFSTSHDGHYSEEALRKIVKEAILLYDADKTGQVDYALESSGGSIVSTRCSETYHAGTARISIFNIPLWYTYNSPRTVIQPDVHPGKCWAFKGSQGYLVIALSATIIPTGFTLEHIPRSLSPSGTVDSAPRDFTVLGLTEENDLDGKVLGQYEYDKNGDALQYFPVQVEDPGYFSILELRILSNHGNMEYTCLYRFRVHGRH